MASITNNTFRQVIQKIEARNNMLNEWLDHYMPEWLVIRENVRAGKAKEEYEIGHEFITTYTYEGTTYECPWVVLDNDRQCEWEDGTKHPGLWLGMKYKTIEKVQFDEKEGTDVDLESEPNALEGWYYYGVDKYNSYRPLNLKTGDPIPTTYISIKKNTLNSVDAAANGYRRWSHSAIRQWLNSDADIGEWWTPQHLGDIAPKQLENIKGFMAGLEPDFLLAITPVKIKTYNMGPTDVTVDKFFLQSAEEVYGVPPETNKVEGPYFPYWKQVTGLSKPENGDFYKQNEARKFGTIDNPSGGGYCWLRTMTTYKSAYAFETLGYIVSQDPDCEFLCSLPACVIS